MRLQRFLERRWYGKHAGLLYVFYPLMCLYQFISTSRKKKQCQVRQPIDTPIVVVGNILVGGTGKTPVIIALARILQQRGLDIGIVSRGYGRSKQASVQFPVYILSEDSSAAQAGDEPLEMYRALGCPIVVGANRTEAVNTLKRHSTPDIILSDDGLQHYALDRDIEIAVFNQAQGIGNGHCLPLGPLRESASRLAEVDFVLINQAKFEHDSVPLLRRYTSFDFSVNAVHWVNVNTGAVRGLNDMQGNTVCAIAGIGQPQKFFDLLESLNRPTQWKNLDCIAKSDHAGFTHSDFAGDHYDTFLMTAKDAVKCKGIASENSWYLLVDAALPTEFTDAFMTMLGPLLKTVK